MASSMDSNHPFIETLGVETSEEYMREQAFVTDGTLTVGRNANASLTLGTDSLIVLGEFKPRGFLLRFKSRCANGTIDEAFEKQSAPCCGLWPLGSSKSGYSLQIALC